MTHITKVVINVEIDNGKSVQLKCEDMELATYELEKFLVTAAKPALQKFMDVIKGGSDE